MVRDGDRRNDPPMVVYKAKATYEGECSGGPSGTIYDATESGWFESRTFLRWFHECFLAVAKKLPGTKVLTGDNLLSHFTPEVVISAQQNNIYFTSLPTNSTNLMQPLDVAVYGPMKRAWREVLFKWRRESKIRGPFPKEHFPFLLQRLYIALKLNLPSNLISGFRACGLHPLDRN